MHEKAARDVSRLLDKPGLRHIVELAEQAAHEQDEPEGHTLLRREQGGHGGTRPPEARSSVFDGRSREGRIPDSRNHPDRSHTDRTHPDRTHRSDRSDR
jgi:hypothetical protein